MEDLAIQNNLLKEKRKHFKKKLSPYESNPNFFHKRNKSIKSGIGETMNLNHSQKVIPFSFNYNKKESNLKRRNYSCRFNINHLHESSCERHKC